MPDSYFWSGSKKRNLNLFKHWHFFLQKMEQRLIELNRMFWEEISTKLFIFNQEREEMIRKFLNLGGAEILKREIIIFQQLASKNDEFLGNLDQSLEKFWKMDINFIKTENKDTLVNNQKIIAWRCGNEKRKIFEDQLLKKIKLNNRRRNLERLIQSENEENSKLSEICNLKKKIYQLGDKLQQLRPKLPKCKFEQQGGEEQEENDKEVPLQKEVNFVEDKAEKKSENIKTKQKSFDLFKKKKNLKKIFQNKNCTCFEFSKLDQPSSLCK